MKGQAAGLSVPVSGNGRSGQANSRDAGSNSPVFAELWEGGGREAVWGAA